MYGVSLQPCPHIQAVPWETVASRMAYGVVWAWHGRDGMVLPSVCVFYSPDTAEAAPLLDIPLVCISLKSTLTCHLLSLDNNFCKHFFFFFKERQLSSFSEKDVRYSHNMYRRPRVCTRWCVHCVMYSVYSSLSNGILLDGRGLCPVVHHAILQFWNFSLKIS